MKTAAAVLTAVKASLLLSIPLLPAAVPAQGEPDPFCDKFKPVHTPVVGSGWTYRVVMADLHTPRGLAFDSAGNLLVVERGSAVRRLAFVGGGGGANDTCLALQQNTVVVRNENVGFSSLSFVESHLFPLPPCPPSACESVRHIGYRYP